MGVQEGGSGRVFLCEQELRVLPTVVSMSPAVAAMTKAQRPNTVDDNIYTIMIIIVFIYYLTTELQSAVLINNITNDE